MFSVFSIFELKEALFIFLYIDDSLLRKYNTTSMRHLKASCKNVNNLYDCHVIIHLCMPKHLACFFYFSGKGKFGLFLAVWPPCRLHSLFLPNTSETCLQQSDRYLELSLLRKTRFDLCDEND